MIKICTSLRTLDHGNHAYYILDIRIRVFDFCDSKQDPGAKSMQAPGARGFEGVGGLLQRFLEGSDKGLRASCFRL